jgi:hypothetical protein
VLPSVDQPEAHAAGDRVLRRWRHVPVLRPVIGELEVVDARAAALMLRVPVIGALEVRGDVLRVAVGTFGEQQRVLDASGSAGRRGRFGWRS